MVKRYLERVCSSVDSFHIFEKVPRGFACYFSCGGGMENQCSLMM